MKIESTDEEAIDFWKLTYLSAVISGKTDPVEWADKAVMDLYQADQYVRVEDD